MVTKEKQCWTFEVLKLSTTHNGCNCSKYASNFKFPHPHTPHTFCTPSSHSQCTLHTSYDVFNWLHVPTITLHAPSVHSPCTLHVLSALPLHTLHTPSMHPLCTLCTPSIHPRMFLIGYMSPHNSPCTLCNPPCTLHAPSMHPLHTLHPPSVYSPHFLHTVSIHPPCTLCALSAHPPYILGHFQWATCPHHNSPCTLCNPPCTLHALSMHPPCTLHAPSAHSPSTLHAS